MMTGAGCPFSLNSMKVFPDLKAVDKTKKNGLKTACVGA
jgi:hypothetical protein